jgi:hypothetical protein
MNANRKEYMLKRNGRHVGADAAEGNGAANAPFELRENDRINAQIDSYIKENPKHWEALKAMPRERLERHAVWQHLRFNARKQKLDDGLLRRIEENPELKQDFEKLLERVPENQRDRARVSIARTLVLSQSRSQKQNPKSAVAV